LFGGVRQAHATVQRMNDTWEAQQQATEVASPPQKSILISCNPLDHISYIKRNWDKIGIKEI